MWWVVLLMVKELVKMVVGVIIIWVLGSNLCF